MTTTAVTAGPEEASPAPAPRTRRWMKVAVAGLLLLQLSWLFATPPFRGSDEFDHVYRAAATARGEWLITPSDATRGTGAWLQVPLDIVQAAQPECQRLPYTTDHDCVGTRHGDTVRIASGAGRYHPLFYAVIGTPALPFRGVAALYVMRLMTMLICAGLFALALWATSTWARTRWPYVAAAVCCTPVLVYSASIVAPNGPEMMAALAFWLSFVGLMTPAAREHRVGLVWAASCSGAVLVTLRALGPLWCLLAAVTVVVALRPTWGYLRELLRDRRVLIGGGVVFVSAVQSVIWTELAGALRLNVAEVNASLGHKLTWALGQVPLWVLQSIAAFPLRDGASHPAVYFTWLLLFSALLVLGLRHARGAVLVGLLLSVLIAAALPYAVAVQSYSTSFGAWQGRYGLPYALGMGVLAGVALDRRGREVGGRFAVLGLLLFGTAQVVSSTKLLYDERPHSPMLPLHLWPAPPVWLLAVVASAGAGALWWSCARPSRSTAP